MDELLELVEKCNLDDLDQCAMIEQVIGSDKHETLSVAGFVSELSKLSASKPKTVPDFNELCRYGEKCFNAKCAYKHPESRIITDCVYGEKCFNKKCAFKHPEGWYPLCLNGANCAFKNGKCKAIHPDNKPVVDWTATVKKYSERPKRVDVEGEIPRRPRREAETRKAKKYYKK